MAIVPTPEDVARHILDRFAASGARAGYVLMAGQMTQIQVDHKLTREELIGGLQYAGDQGWIDNGPNSSIKLTEAGYEAM